MLTGESIPVEKSVGDSMVGGSFNETGSVRYQATKVGKDTTLAQIIQLVQDAQGSKAPIAKMGDIISGYFVQIVIVLAIVSSLAWRSEEHTSELQSRGHLVCRLRFEQKKH